MTVGWVAATTRGRSLATRLVGLDGAQAIAHVESWPQARSLLASTVYGNTLALDADRHAAHRAVAATTAWYLRVVAGWLPANGAGLARLMAGPVEISNVEQHFDRLAGDETAAPVDLGSLAVAWPRIAATTSVGQVRTVLRHSSWGDPGVGEPPAIIVGLWLSWLRRLSRQVDEFGPEARGAAAVVLARETLAFERTLAHPAGEDEDRLLTRAWRNAATLPDLQRRLPDSAGWALAPVDSVDDLWKAELGVVAAFALKAQQLLARPRSDRSAVAAFMVLVLVDRWRVDAAIEVAGRRPREVFDDVA
ncbi:MAG: hypothetical protein R2733_10595 [Acidimicrobiales bacterium]